MHALADPGPPLVAVDATLAAGAAVPHPAWIAPFAALLLAIAVLPLAAHRFWESNRNKAIVAALVSAPTFAYLLLHDRSAIGHAALEYVSFIALLGSLYVVSGGILVTGDIEARPRTNTALLAIGGILANLVGTTGASMLLIRPLLRINSERRLVTHTVVFFIFVVSNVGGCLTPLGDPPLFLGYLRGVPFEWTLTLWKEWLFTIGALLAAYHALDTAMYRRERPEALEEDRTRIEPLAVRGLVNAPLLLGIVIAVVVMPTPFREAFMVGGAVFSLAATPWEVRKENGFGFGPIVEVAVLFAGIFVAMVPALQILEARAPDLGLSRPLHFFVASGTLSAFLDNAPTYLTFLSVAKGLHAAGAPGTASVAVDGGAVPEPLLVAISLGSVFMGALTYIGNGPNFMVRAIAEESGVKMPTFFGYLVWSVGVLGPVLALMAALFVA
jgi:Na+/H+ antiporter NhaD/arsenite permease-like protein